MWKCANCGEQVNQNFELCWNCGTSRDGSERVDVTPEGEGQIDKRLPTEEAHNSNAPESLLKQIIEQQKQQELMLNDIQSKVGCLYFYMIAGIVLVVLGVFINVLR